MSARSFKFTPPAPNPTPVHSWTSPMLWRNATVDVINHIEVLCGPAKALMSHIRFNIDTADYIFEVVQRDPTIIVEGPAAITQADGTEVDQAALPAKVTGELAAVAMATGIVPNHLELLSVRTAPTPPITPAVTQARRKREREAHALEQSTEDDEHVTAIDTGLDPANSTGDEAYPGPFSLRHESPHFHASQWLEHMLINDDASGDLCTASIEAPTL